MRMSSPENDEGIQQSTFRYGSLTFFEISQVPEFLTKKRQEILFP